MSEPTETTPLSPEGGENNFGDRIACLQTWANVGAHVWVVVAIVANLVWFEQRGGSAKVFNWHPLLMVLGFCIMTVSTLSFQHYTILSRPVRKFVHGLGFSIMIVCATLAMFAVVTQHNGHPYAHMVSLHDWMGFTVILFYLIQFFFAVYAYGQLPCFNPSVRFKLNLLKLHKYFGITIYQLTAVVMLLGIQEKEGFLPTNCEYHIAAAQTNIWTSLSNLHRIPAQCKAGHVLGFGILVTSVLTSFATYDFGKKK